MVWIRSPLTQDINWTYIRRSEDVLDVLCTFNLRPVSTGLILEAKFGGGHYLVMPLAVAITAWKVSECWKIRTGKTSNTNTFHAVNNDGKTGWIVNPVINSINRLFNGLMNYAVMSHRIERIGYVKHILWRLLKISQKDVYIPINFTVFSSTW